MTVDHNSVLIHFTLSKENSNQVRLCLLLVPGHPTSLMLDSPSETEMTLHWAPPAEPNGVLVGYLLQYQQSEHRSHTYLTK